MPLPDQITQELQAMDAALRGEAVDPEFAELAELALLLADAKPALSETRATELDRRVSGLAAARVPPRVNRRAHRASRTRPWLLRPAFGAGLAVVAALVVVVVLAGTHGSGSSSGPDLDFSAPPAKNSSAAVHTKSAAADTPTAAATSTVASSASASGASSSSTSGASSSSTSGASSSSSPGASSGGSGIAAGVSSQSAQSLASTVPALSSLPSTANSAGATVTPTPQSNGRRTIQTDQLTLAAPGARIATVSQELFNVVGAEQGIVKHSQVNSGNGGFASFTLQIPTGNLSATLARLAELRYAHVTSSSAATADVNSQYLDDQRKLSDAKALRTSLLTQLQTASTTADIDSLKAQIQDAESTISSDEGTLNSLQTRISYSAVSVQINPGAAPVAHHAGSHGGFSLAKAAHDAGDVLVAVGGGLLIALAVLVPLGLLIGLSAWLTARWRRRGRERALDAI